MVKVDLRYWLQRSAKASTLIEVTTALVIISMVFSLAIMIYLNVQRGGVGSAKLTYYIMLDEAYANMQRSSDFSAKEYEVGETVIHQNVDKHAASSDLLIIRLEARSKEGKLLAEKKHLIYAPAKSL